MSPLPDSTACTAASSERATISGSSSLCPPSIAAVASGCDIDTVRWSSALYFASPHSFAAAICRMIACMSTFTAGSAMRWLSLKSRIVLIAALRVTST